MGLRKDLLDHIPIPPPGIDTSGWVSGRYFTVSLRGTALSAENAMYGVVLLIDSPTHDVLYQFADLSALQPQYGEATTQMWRDLLARSIRMINQSHFISPAPSMVVYSDLKPFRYPSREFALSRLFRRHVNFLLPANQKTSEDGGVLIASATSRINEVLAAVQMSFSRALDGATHGKTGDMATIGLHGSAIGLIEITRQDAQQKIQRAGAQLILMPQRKDTATLVAICDQAAELSDQLNEQIAMFRQALGVDVQISSSDQSVARVGRWLRTVGD